MGRPQVRAGEPGSEIRCPDWDCPENVLLLAYDLHARRRVHHVRHRAGLHRIYCREVRVSCPVSSI